MVRELRRRVVAVDTGLGARTLEAPDAHLDPAAQHRAQLRDVDSGTAVDVRRVLPGQQIDAHVATLARRGVDGWS
ncbi:hypothetical protein GCM10010972_06380 [Cellulomonas carbonis]|nr:hypothetical protein GCM10010972_06380 [Cellulomonas carbonis]